MARVTDWSEARDLALPHKRLGKEPHLRPL